MNGLHPLVKLAALWLVVMAVLTLVLVCTAPERRTYTEAPTRVPMTVLPTQTVYVFTTPTIAPSLVPEPILTARDPQPTSTRVPTSTPTVVPTPNTTPPVQRG